MRALKAIHSKALSAEKYFKQFGIAISQLGFFNEIPDLVYSSQNLNFLADTPMALGLSTVERETGILRTTAGYVAPSSLSEVDEILSGYLPGGDGSRYSLVPPPSISNNIFQFAIERRIPGEYKIEKWNYQERVTTSEPGAIAGFIATVGLTLKFLKRRTN